QSLDLTGLLCCNVSGSSIFPWPSFWTWKDPGFQLAFFSPLPLKQPFHHLLILEAIVSRNFPLRFSLGRHSLDFRQQRSLEPVYAVVFLDAIHFHVRSEGQIVKKAVYIAIGINLDGRKDVLGMWVGENESAKFWATVLNGLRNRGVEDIFIACTDNLTGFSAAIEAVFPKTEIQNRIIHQIRNSTRYVSYKDLKALMADLKAVYAAVDEAAALEALDVFAQRWDKKYPKISASWQDNWPNLSTYFKFPQEVRRLIYTTNAIGSTAGSSARFISTISGTQAMRCIRSPYVWSDLRSKRACTKP
ncbi:MULTISPECIES: IS256 family transposase, partial [Lawsonibacter]|uniref:IS256 family transposase n=1 Tax=Lawsonibacter hominis TaxID=2763053 RepID=UPI00258E4022